MARLAWRDMTAQQRTRSIGLTMYALNLALGVRVFLLAYDSHVVIKQLFVPPKRGMRGTGLARQAMTDLTEWADDHLITLGLTPSPQFGADLLRLVRFYTAHGFVPNCGPGALAHVETDMIRKVPLHLKVDP